MVGSADDVANLNSFSVQDCISFTTVVLNRVSQNLNLKQNQVFCVTEWEQNVTDWEFEF